MPVSPALWEAKAGRSPKVRSSNQPGKYGETQSLLIKNKDTKSSQAWWWVPIIPAIQDAEAGESLEPGRWRLQ